MKRIIIDLDGTLTDPRPDADYASVPVREDVVDALRRYAELGYEIVIHTARGMRSHDGRVGRINVDTLPTIMQWLHEHDVPHDEVIVGKPWCGTGGFYVDDRSLRPDEFAAMSAVEVNKLLGIQPKPGTEN